MELLGQLLPDVQPLGRQKEGEAQVKEEDLNQRRSPQEDKDNIGHSQDIRTEETPLILFGAGGLD